jgi:hypothetical protein
MEYGHMRSMPSSIARATAGAALALLVIAMGITAARAASLGKLEIVSGVGEPLRGRIEVTGATRHELDTLGARLGSPVQYGEAGLTYVPALERMRFNLATQRGRHYINVISNERYNEPVVDLVVELAWFGGAKSYAYTALIDPAGSEKSPSVSAPSALNQTSNVALSPRKTRKSSPHALKTVAAAETRGATGDAPVADEIRLEEGKAVQAKHKLAAAQERIAELERTLEEQEHLLSAVAADAIVGDMRSTDAPGITRVSHETPITRQATPVQPAADAWDSAYLAGGGVAAMLAILAFMRRGRRVGASKEAYLRLAPSLQAAT